MRIAFVGGGSGGHFYPLMAIAESLMARTSEQALLTPELYYLGPNTYDQSALFEHNISFIKIGAGKTRRYLSILNVVDLFKTFFGVFISIWKLFILYPDVIMSKGGYTSVPIVIAAWILRIPIVIHESDATPGRANKLAGKFARYIAISYPEVASSFKSEKVVLTGIPVRKALLTATPQNARALLSIEMEKPLIFVWGGSQGAVNINELVIQSLNELLPHYAVLHQTGEMHIEDVRMASNAFIADKPLMQSYRAVAFLKKEELHAALSEASIVISRAGSGSIFEIALHGKPSILIPIPEDVSHDQRSNAYAYARTGAASVLEEKNVSPHLLQAEITRIMSDSTIAEKMESAALLFAPRDSAESIADILISIALDHE